LQTEASWSIVCQFKKPRLRLSSGNLRRDPAALPRQSGQELPCAKSQWNLPSRSRLNIRARKRLRPLALPPSAQSPKRLRLLRRPCSIRFPNRLRLSRIKASATLSVTLPKELQMPPRALRKT